MPLLIGAAVVGGVGAAYGAYKSHEASQQMKEYDRQQLATELQPWQQDIDALRNLSTQTQSQAQQYFDPRSAYYDQQRQIMSEQVAQQTANVTSQQNQLMAQRGMGGGGMRGLLGAVNANQAGEQVRQGMSSIQQQGFSMGSGLLGQSSSMLNAAMGAQGAHSENMAQAYISNIEQQNAMKAQEANAWSAFSGSMGQMGSAAMPMPT